MFNLIDKLTSDIKKSFKVVFDHELVDISLQPTRKEFAGHYTLVMFPYLKITRRSPEESGEELGKKLLEESTLISSYNVVKGFLNLEIADSAWIKVLNELKEIPNYGFMSLKELYRKEQGMFCYQCEQTAKGTGCDRFGVCGKDPETAVLQDLLVYVAKGVSNWAFRARKLGVLNRDADIFVIEALFTTVTNVNFDSDTLINLIRTGTKIRNSIRDLYLSACEEKGVEPEELSGPAVWEIPANESEIKNEAAKLSIAERLEDPGKDITGLEELITYGLKGSASYADHALILGFEDDDVYSFFHESLDFLTRKNTVGDLFAMALMVGEKNLRVMELLDSANTGI